MSIATKVALLVGLAIVVAHAAEAPLETRVAALTERLSHGSFPERVNAEDELSRLPPEALPLLERVVASPATSVDVRDTVARQIALMRAAARAREIVARLNERVDAHADWLIAQYNAHGHRGAWDGSVEEAIHARVDTPALRGRAALRRSRAALERATDAGCDDPLVLFLLLQTRQELSEPANLDETLAPLPEQLRKRGYAPSIQSLAHLRRAERTWQRLHRTHPSQARRDSADDLSRAITTFAKASAHEFEDDEQRVLHAQAIATLITRADPDAVATRLNDFLRLVAPADRDDVFSVALRLASLNTADLALNETPKDIRTPWRNNVSTYYEQALAIAANDAYAEDATILRIRYQVAVSRRELTKADELLGSLLHVDRDCDETLVRHLDFLTLKRDYAGMNDLAKLAEAMPATTTHPRLIRGAVEWQIGLLQHRDPAGYLSQAEVWDRVTRAFDAHLKCFPDDRLAHAHYAWYAYHAGRIEIAKLHFDAAADDGDDPTSASLADYQTCRRKTDEIISAAAQSQ